MKDWSEAKRLYAGTFGYHPSGRELMDAITEIERLRADVAGLEGKMDAYYKMKQEKAELVEALQMAVGALDCYDREPYFTIKQLLAKHGGEPK